MSAPVRLVLLGAGRMGRAVAAAAAVSPDFEVAAVVARSGGGDPFPDDPARYENATAALAAGMPATVAVDFTRAEAVAAHAEACAAAGTPLVEGTTGLDEAARTAVRRAAERIPVVLAPNLSPGIAVLRRFLAEVGGSGLGWEATLLERHHRHKLDTPSGTARLLGRAWMEAAGSEPPIVSLRQGEIVGEHTVWLGGEEEELVLTHRALDRSLFARGALRAAAWAATAESGVHTMEDVLGL